MGKRRHLSLIRPSLASEPSSFVIVRAISLAVAGVVVASAWFPRLLPVMVVVTAGLVLLHSWTIGSRLDFSFGRSFFLVSAFIGWIALTALWSGDVSAGLGKSALIAGMAGSAWVFWSWLGSRSDNELFVIQRALVLTFALMALLVFADLLAEQTGVEWVMQTIPQLQPGATSVFILPGAESLQIAPDFYNRGIAGLLLLLPSSVAAWVVLFPRPEQALARWAFAAPCAALVVAAFLSSCGTCKLATGSMILTATLLLCFGVAILWRMVTAASVAGLVLAPVVAAAIFWGVKDTLVTLPNSVSERILIWKDATTAVAARPLVGHGIRSTRLAHRSFQKAHPGATRPYRVPFPGFHPHNGFLQIWRELGLVGVILFCSALIACAGSVHSRFSGRTEPAHLGATGLLTLVGVLSVLAAGWGIWQTWLVAIVSMLVPLHRLQRIL